MSELTLVEAINDAFHFELERDENVLVMGEDVGRAGGVFRASAGLRDKFGPERCVDTPLAEAGILGDGLAESIRAEALELMRAGIAQAESEPEPDPALLFRHAFADPPQSFEHDLAELRRILGGSVG